MQTLWDSLPAPAPSDPEPCQEQQPQHRSTATTSPKREPTLHHPIEKGPTYFGFVTSISCKPPQTTPPGNQSITFSRNHWPAEPMGLSSWLLATFEDPFQSGFVSRCDFLTGQAEDLRISNSQ